MYLFQGAAGLPVFALGGFGFLSLLGPRGGYLFGYVIAAYVTGYLIERMRMRTAHRVFVSLVVGNAIIYFFGIFQLSFFIGYKSAIILGMIPFIAGDILKLLVIYAVIKRFTMRPHSPT